MIEPAVVSQNGWMMRVRPGNIQRPHRLLVLLHGWSGNEDVMWIFARRLPPDMWIISPRGPINAPEGGFGWFPTGSDRIPSLPEIKPGIEQLLTMIGQWAKTAGVDDSRITLMGFSQGALLSFAITLLFTPRVTGMASLAGYLPEKWGAATDLLALQGKPIYIAHGTQDTTIPVALARQTVQFLENNGANVIYCESETGHKLSLGCLNGLESFFQNLPAADQGNKTQEDP